MCGGVRAGCAKKPLREERDTERRPERRGGGGGASRESSLGSGPVGCAGAEMASHREGYAAKLYEINSDPKRIAPTWSRVTSTPWTSEARRLQGYGRNVVNATTSKDAPLFISKNSSGVTERRPVVKMSSRDESLAVMPGGLKTPAPRLHGTKIIKLSFKKEVIFEPVYTARTERSDMSSGRLSQR